MEKEEKKELKVVMGDKTVPEEINLGIKEELESSKERAEKKKKF